MTFDLTNKKILLVRNDNIGDAVLSTPALQAIKERYPTCFIGVFCAGYSREAFETNPYIDRLFVYEKAKHRAGIWAKIAAWIGHVRVMMRIRSEGFDFAVGLRSAFSRSNGSLVRWSGAKTKVVRLPQKPSDMGAFDAFIDEDTTDRRERDNVFDCLKLFGIEDTGYKPLIKIPSWDAERAQKKLKEAGFWGDKYVVFHISSRLGQNRWKLKNFEKLSRLIASELGLKVAVTAAPKSAEEEEAKKIFSKKNAMYFETKTLFEFGAIVSNSVSLVTLDGGAMHFGSVFAPCVVAIFGKTNPAVWKPVNERATLLTAESKKADDVDVESVFLALKPYVS